MKTIGITELGTLASADANLFSSTGELLISKGEAIPPERIDTLRARTITEVYALETGDSLLEALFTATFAPLDELPEDAAAPAPSSGDFAHLPILSLPAIRQIKPGQAGYEQLLSVCPSVAINRTLKTRLTTDVPCGPPVHVAEAAAVDDRRNDGEKERLCSAYAALLERCRRLFDALMRGTRIDGSAIRAMAVQILQIYTEDSSFMLNLANSRGGMIFSAITPSTYAFFQRPSLSRRGQPAADHRNRHRRAAARPGYVDCPRTDYRKERRAHVERVV